MKLTETFPTRAFAIAIVAGTMMFAVSRPSAEAVEHADDASHTEYAVLSVRNDIVTLFQSDRTMELIPRRTARSGVLNEPSDPPRTLRTREIDDTNPFVTVLNELSLEGWEVVTQMDAIGGTRLLLKRES